MYKYEYEKITYNFQGWGAFHGNIYEPDNFMEIINKRSENDWKYIGYIPTNQRTEGLIQEITLIFEKEIKKGKE